MNGQLNKQLHTLLTSSGLTSQKAALVASYTSGRSESSKDMKDSEAEQLIKYLQTQVIKPDSRQKQRRKIISLAHELHWHLPGTSKVDMNRLNDWCIKFGFGKKKLNDYTATELPKLVTQFNNVYKDYLNKI